MVESPSYAGSWPIVTNYWFDGSLQWESLVIRRAKGGRGRPLSSPWGGKGIEVIGGGSNRLLRAGGRFDSSRTQPFHYCPAGRVLILSKPRPRGS